MSRRRRPTPRPRVATATVPDHPEVFGARPRRALEVVKAESKALVGAAAQFYAAATARVRASRRSADLTWQQEVYCVDETTEILTIDGWRTHDQLMPGTLVRTLTHDAGWTQWEPIIDVSRFEVVDQPMLSIELRHHSSLTTADHRWPVWRQTYDNKLKSVGRSNRAGYMRAWTTSRGLRAEDQIITAAPASDLPIDPKWSDAFVELMGWFWTEGCVKQGKRPNIAIGQSIRVNPGHVARIRAALTAVFGPVSPLGNRHTRPYGSEFWTESAPNDVGMIYFRLSWAASAQVLAVAPGRTKVIDLGFIRELTLSQLRLFMHVSCLADGHLREGFPPSLTQGDLARLEPYLYAAVLAGDTPHFDARINPKYGTPYWDSNVLPRSTVTPRRARSRSWVPYTGTVWCPTTPSGTWLARRNGTVWYTGNSLFSEVGELRYVANSVANAGSLAALYVSKQNEDGIWERVEDDPDDPGFAALAALAGDSPVGQTELLRRHGLHLFLFGETWLVGHPPIDDSGMPLDQAVPEADQGIRPQGGDGIDLTTLQWGAYSPLEVQERSGVLIVGPAEHPREKCVAFRIWRPSAAFAGEADSPCRSILPVLRIIRGLTRRVGAELDSRFARSGVMTIPTSLTVLGAQPPEEDGLVDSFVTWLMEAISAAIRDPESASAVCPIVVTVPDEIADKDLIKHFTLDSGFDENTVAITDLMIRRLALGLDAPPERLLGLGDSTHWNAWIVGADEIKLMISPWLALIRDGWTRKYLRRVLEEAAKSDPSIDPLAYSIDADLSELTVQPDRSEDALQLQARGLISDDAAREASGFGPDDAPEPDPWATAMRMALEAVKDAPTLADHVSRIAEDIYRMLTSGPPDGSTPIGETDETDEPEVEPEVIVDERE